METRPGNFEDIYPLSPMQQGMLFHTLYSARDNAPLLQWSCRFENDVDVPPLRRAWERVIEHHAILRTAVVLEDGGEPVQVVFRSVPLPWRERDLGKLSPSDRERSVHEFLEQDRHAGFELLEPPLMRLTLIRLTDSACVFVWTFHLLLLDGWSMAAVLNEVWALYEAFCRGEEPRLESRRPYRDYIAWYQRPDPLLAEPFWRKTLKGIVAPTPLVIDRTPTTAVEPGEDYAEQEIRFSREATRALHSFCRQHRLTLSTLIRASWALLLSRYSGETSVVFGATVSGRPPGLPGVESIVGLLINTLPVRVDVPEDEPILPWLKRLQEQQSELLEYESSRLVDVQGWSEVPRGRPLFESVLVVQTYPTDEALKLSRERLGIPEAHLFERTNIPLTVQVRPGEELSVSISFECARFESSAILGMLSHFRTLLERIVSDPAQTVFALSPLTEDERRQLLIEWNATDVDYPERGKSLSRLFEENSARTPNATALVFGEQVLSYRELNARANRLARLLRSMSVRREIRVGVFMERSVEMVVALLSILKSGGAYVPLDPADPEARRAFVLQDAGISLVLTQEHLLESLSEVSVRKIVVDTEEERISRESSENLPGETTPEDLAYAIYTSGSTGKPKGVLVTHRSLVNLLLSMATRPGLTEKDVLLAVTTFAFDIAALELFLPLVVGARLVLTSREVALDGASLSAKLAECNPSVMQATPAGWQLLLAAGWRGSNRLKILCGGEALSRDLALALLGKGASVWNLYGPTETTIWSAVQEVRETEVATIAPIGRPIANTRMYILDRHRRPVPVGVVGELYIGGEGVARGYIDRPELTAERFLLDPFSPEPGRRMYRTGDLTRYRSDGVIEFLGRADDQVKIRGHRIELGEIETVIVQHPGIRGAVVAAREDTPGDRRLVAYLVCEKGATPSNSEMRALMRRSLPEYMVPAAFVRLERLPLTSSGKVDRRALPAPEKTRSGLEGVFAAPRTPIEEMLAGIWKQVLNLDQVGIHDNFFELGGHSILATQVFSRIRNDLQVALPLRHLFERPTIQALAQLIETARVEGLGPQPPQLRRVSRDRELPLSFAQQRLWFIDQLEPDNSSYNIGRALRLRGVFDYEAIRRAMVEIVTRHESLRTTFRNREGRPVQVVSDVGPFALPVRDLSGLAMSDRESEALRLVGEEVKRPFDLTDGPLLRSSLFPLGPEEHIFLVVIHHIVCDGWSMGVFFRELEVLYQAFSRGEPSPLPPVALQYADYAVWERDWFQGAVLEKQLSYWTEQLHGAPAVLDLRGDRPRPALRSSRGARQRFSLPTSVAERIAVLSRNEGVTLYMTLLAAFAVLLWRQTGQEEIVVGSPIFGRDRIETEGLIGFFINTIVLRTDLTGNPSFRELLSRVRETALGAYDHQEVPLERLVDALKLERSLSHNPLFQVWFVLQDAGGPPPALAGLSVEDIPLETQAIRHDLQLSISETPAGLAGELDYATDIFDPPTVACLARRFEALLTRIVAHPESRLQELRAELDGEEEVERGESRRQRDEEMRRRLEIGKRRTVRG